MIKFTVPGKPQGKGRPRFARMGKFVKTYTPAETESYEALIKLCCMEACIGKPLLDGALAIDIQAKYPIPASWSNKKKEMALRGELRPTVKPDFDNLAKVICDSLNGIAYKDDTQIVSAKVFKYYAEKPCVEVEIVKVE